VYCLVLSVKASWQGAAALCVGGSLAFVNSQVEQDGLEHLLSLTSVQTGTELSTNYWISDVNDTVAKVRAALLCYPGFPTLPSVAVSSVGLAVGHLHKAVGQRSKSHSNS
jgi:H+/Cl- antiporter ClcA